jgi:hypothetical protein
MIFKLSFFLLFLSALHLAIALETITFNGYEIIANSLCEAYLKKLAFDSLKNSGNSFLLKISWSKLIEKLKEVPEVVLLKINDTTAIFLSTSGLRMDGKEKLSLVVVVSNTSYEVDREKFNNTEKSQWVEVKSIQDALSIINQTQKSRKKNTHKQISNSSKDNNKIQTHFKLTYREVDIGEMSNCIDDFYNNS